ncbi:MAG: ATP-binding cassette domain-containing protein [Spirochaetota bacterium]
MDYSDRCLIEVRNISHTYFAGTPLAVSALRNVSIEVHENEAVGIIGPAGSGKSTLLQHLNGLLRPEQGEVYIEGSPLSEMTDEITGVRQRVGLVFQMPEKQLFKQYAGDDIAFGPINLGLSSQEVRRRVKKAMHMTGLPFSFKDRLTQELSQGEKRLLALSGVLAMEPQVLVLDEPTANLDPQGRKQILSILKNWARRAKRAVVLASHSMEDIAELCTRVYVIADGRVVTEGESREVFSNYTLLEQNGLSLTVPGRVMRGLIQNGFRVDAGVVSYENAAQQIRGLLNAWKV